MIFRIHKYLILVVNHIFIRWGLRSLRFIYLLFQRRHFILMIIYHLNIPHIAGYTIILLMISSVFKIHIYWNTLFIWVCIEFLFILFILGSILAIFHYIQNFITDVKWYLKFLFGGVGVDVIIQFIWNLLYILKSVIKYLKYIYSKLF